MKERQIMYEITFIAKDEKTPQVKQFLQSLDAKIISEESLGRKKLAYPIKKEQAGFYSTIIFEIDGQNLQEFNQKLKLEESILRYLVIKKEKVKIKKEKVKKEQVTETTKIIEKMPQATDSMPEKTDTLKTIGKPKVETGKTAISKKPLERPEKSKKKIILPKPTKFAEKITPKEENVSEEDRLKKLEEKLDELLKE